MEDPRPRHRARAVAWWWVGGFGVLLLLAQLLLVFSTAPASEAQSAATAIPLSWAAVLLYVSYAMAVADPILDLVVLLIFVCWCVMFFGATAMAMRTLQDVRSTDRRTTRSLTLLFALGSLAWAIGDWENRRAAYGTGWSVTLLVISLLCALVLLRLLRTPTSARRSAPSLAPALLMQFWLLTVWLPAAPTA